VSDAPNPEQTRQQLAQWIRNLADMVDQPDGIPRATEHVMEHVRQALSPVWALGRQYPWRVRDFVWHADEQELRVAWTITRKPRPNLSAPPEGTRGTPTPVITLLGNQGTIHISPPPENPAAPETEEGSPSTPGV